jgi:2-oxoglutarate dehydrogenase complex dehydrogenase (E1) component-like enzyme
LARFLQSTDDDADEPYHIDDPDAQIQQCNWQVASPSTPANYFHLLRRQVDSIAACAAPASARFRLALNRLPPPAACSRRVALARSRTAPLRRQLCRDASAARRRPRVIAASAPCLQLIRDFRKPLIVSEPKGLFRHKLAVSPIEDFGPGE